MDVPLKTSPIEHDGREADQISPVEDLRLRCKGHHFLDAHGRTCLLRGVNLSGSTKLPFEPRLPTHDTDRQRFFAHRSVSFVGRPFPLADADEHLQRLRSWGLLFLRFQITWEAIEHAGPGKYDLAYMDYVVDLLRKAKGYGFQCFIDPHQDVWSRFTGGSGAPGWTLELVGFDLTKLVDAGAAIVQNLYTPPEAFPRMIWPTNYSKLATATMFTFFFGGAMFAPRCQVEMRSRKDPMADDCMITLSDEQLSAQRNGTLEHEFDLQDIQEYLQSHYIAAIVAFVQHLKQAGDLLDSVVVGYDTLNEPSGGFLGFDSLCTISDDVDLKNGAMPTPIQAMLAGEGITCSDVELWRFGALGPKRTGTTQINPNGVRCWRDGYGCPWLAHGLYDKDAKVVLRDSYFHCNPYTNEELCWIRDLWRPFVRGFTNSVRAIHPSAIIFVEPPVTKMPPRWSSKDGDPTEAICFTPHWYDGITLMNKRFSSLWTVDYMGLKRGKYRSVLLALSFGINGIKKNFAGQLSLIRDEGRERVGKTPFLLGEFGIPYDMADKRAYSTGDYHDQHMAMDANLTAVERCLGNATLWNYCADNTHRWGDQWNGEDLSLWSRDDVLAATQERIAARISTARLTPTNLLPIEDLNYGGRATSAFVRPYAMRTAGTPLDMSFDCQSSARTFCYRFVGTTTPPPRRPGYGTEIFVPRLHYGLPLDVGEEKSEHEKGCIRFTVRVSDGSWTYDASRQLVQYYHENTPNAGSDVHEVIVEVFKPPRRKSFTRTRLFGCCTIQ